MNSFKLKYDLTTRVQTILKVCLHYIALNDDGDLMITLDKTE